MTRPEAYGGMELLFGDLHNHCGLSYGHGTLDEALKNAAEQLDFCSITGHAHWPDMPEATERTQYIIDFHEEGFARLKKGWKEMIEALRAREGEEDLVVFPGFEIHSNADGDRTVLYKALDGEILYARSIPDLHERLAGLRKQGLEAVSFPHHIGYRLGTRGINWETFNAEVEPFIEIISMHGCSEDNECTRPFLHVMGPCDGKSTVQSGLALGHVFGFSGGTDHHSAHPGSYGHGATGVWAHGRDRKAIWEALTSRRTYALTGDRIRLMFALNGLPMGASVPRAPHRKLEIDVQGAGALDCIDVLKNNRLLRRFSQTDVPAEAPGDPLNTLLYLEVGWGPRNRASEWDVRLELSDGSITGVEPRFRGREVVAPTEGREGDACFYESHWGQQSERVVSFRTITYGNPNNFTNGSQGIVLAVRMPADASIAYRMNGREGRVSLDRLIQGAFSGDLDGMDSPAYRFHRAPLPHELRWRFKMEDRGASGDVYYVRVRQKNDQWAWSSPVFVT